MSSNKSTIFSVGILICAFLVFYLWQQKEADELLARFPASEGRNELLQHCSSCHNLKYVLAAAPRSAAEWQRTVRWMEAMQGMTKLPPTTEDKIVAYLSREFGRQAAPPEKPQN